MNDETRKVLVVESDEALKASLVTLFSDVGYEVSTDHREGIQAVLAFAPDLVLLGAHPPQLDCCELLSEIKSLKHTHHIRVVMLVQGGSAERSFALNLGADDALSLPMDRAELLSRVRAQLHSKQDAEELEERIRS